MLAGLRYKYYSLLATQGLTRIGCGIYDIKLSFYILKQKTRFIMSKNFTSNTKVDSSNSLYYYIFFKTKWKEHDIFFNEFKKEHDMTCVILKVC